MALPTLKPTDRVHLPERHHTDPPALWIAVILGSVLIHVAVFWMLRQLLMGHPNGVLSRTAPIPVDVMTVAPNGRSSTPITQTTGSGGTRKLTPTSIPTRKTANQVPKHQTSVSTRSSSRTNSGQASATPSTITHKPNVPKQNVSGTTVPATGTSVHSSPTKSPITNSSQDQPSNSQSEPTSPNPPQSEPSDSQSGSSSSNSQQRGSFLTSIRDMEPTYVNSQIQRDISTQHAKLIQGSPMTFPTSYLRSLGIQANQPLVLKARVRVKSDGTPIVEPNSAQLLPGNISATTAERLAKEIIEKWTFEPSYMGNVPVEQPYNIELNISPLLH